MRAIPAEAETGVRTRSARRLATEVATSAVAVCLAALAFTAFEPAPAPVEVAAAPVLSPSSGKIVDRFGKDAEIGAAVQSRSSAELVALFNFDQAGRPVLAFAAAPMASVLAEIEQASPSPRTRPAETARPAAPIRMAAAAPLPPTRPAPSLPASVAASPAPEDEPVRLLGISLPRAGEILPAGQAVLKRVASLGDTLLDDLIP